MTRPVEGSVIDTDALYRPEGRKALQPETIQTGSSYFQSSNFLLIQMKFIMIHVIINDKYILFLQHRCFYSEQDKSANIFFSFFAYYSKVHPFIAKCIEKNYVFKELFVKYCRHLPLFQHSRFKV